MPTELVADYNGGGDSGDGGGGPNPPQTSYPPIITTTSLPNGSIGTPYSQTVQEQSGTAPFVWSISAGVLPPGLALASATGTISGTPTATGAYTFIVQVEDADSLIALASFTLSIPSTPTIANSSLPNGTVGVPYDASLVGQGGAAPYGFQIIGGGLPSGLALASTGGITGTPTVAVTVSVDIEIYDSNLPQGVGNATYSITIQPSNITSPVTTIDETVLLAGVDGAIYAIAEGQRHDEDYNGNPVAFLQQWNGVRGSHANLAVLQLGGASISAKGNGNLNVYVQDDDGNVTTLSTANRPMILSATETKRDFMAKGVPHSERYGLGFNNMGVINNPDGSTSMGAIVDAWFELHVAILWVRQFFNSRKA